MPRTITLTGLVVAKSGTIDIRQYATDQIYQLLSFEVIRQAAVSHSHALIVADSNNANAVPTTIGISGGQLIGSKSEISAANATSNETTGYSKETKTVINNGFPTSTVPSDDSVALVDKKTIKIGNDLTDSLVGTEVVIIKYVPTTAYPVPT